MKIRSRDIILSRIRIRIKVGARPEIRIRTRFVIGVRIQSTCCIQIRIIITTRIRFQRQNYVLNPIIPSESESDQTRSQARNRDENQNQVSGQNLNQNSSSESKQSRVEKRVMTKIGIRIKRIRIKTTLRIRTRITDLIISKASKSRVEKLKERNCIIIKILHYEWSGTDQSTICKLVHYAARHLKPLSCPTSRKESNTHDIFVSNDHGSLLCDIHKSLKQCL